MVIIIIRLLKNIPSVQLQTSVQQCTSGTGCGYLDVKCDRFEFKSHGDLAVHEHNICSMEYDHNDTIKIIMHVITTIKPTIFMYRFQYKCMNNFLL